MADGDGAQVSTQAIYDLLLEVRDDVHSLGDRFLNLRDRVDDHEQRLRDVEAHGSSNAQASAAELVRTRDRLHKLEGTQEAFGAAIVENAKTIKEVSEAVRGTTSTLMKVSLLLLSVVLTAAATFIVFTSV